MHGIAFAMCIAILSHGHRSVPDTLGEAYFFVMVVPALMLATPFQPLLWHFHLMEAPGWFAWPQPGGFLLVYFAWTLALLAVSVLVRSLKERGNAC